MNWILACRNGDLLKGRNQYILKTHFGRSYCSGNPNGETGVLYSEPA